MRSSDVAAPPGRWRARRPVSIVMVLLGCVLLVNGIVGDNGLLATFAAGRKYKQLEMSVARARMENAQLRERARRLREDPTAIEDLARRELGLIRPGEKLFIVRDVPPRH